LENSHIILLFLKLILTQIGSAESFTLGTERFFAESRIFTLGRASPRTKIGPKAHQPTAAAEIIYKAPSPTAAKP
jgi:hypothetical protein